MEWLFHGFDTFFYTNSQRVHAFNAYSRFVHRLYRELHIIVVEINVKIKFQDFTEMSMSKHLIHEIITLIL